MCDAVGFNWLIGGTDAHAKNYSLLLSSGSRVRLAPFYDIASILPYPEFDMHKLKLAMKVGGEYPLLTVGIRQWQKLAREIRISGDALIDRLTAMARQLPDEVTAAQSRAQHQGLRNPTVERLTAALIERATECAKALTISQP